jgi:hypothetical protein
MNKSPLINAQGTAIYRQYGSFPGVLADTYQLNNPGVTTKSVSSYTLTDADNGKIVVFTSSSAVTLTIPAGLTELFTCSLVQYGTGQVTVAAGTGVTLRLRGSTNKTGGQYAIASLISVVTNEYILAGDTST